MRSLTAEDWARSRMCGRVLRHVRLSCDDRPAANAVSVQLGWARSRLAQYEEGVRTLPVDALVELAGVYAMPVSRLLSLCEIGVASRLGEPQA